MVFKFVRVVKEKEEEKEGKGEEGKRKREKRERRGRNYRGPRKPTLWAYHMVLVVKNPPASAGDIRDMGLIPGSGRSPGAGNGNPLKNSCLESSMDRRA